MSGVTDNYGLITVVEGEAYDEEIFNANNRSIDAALVAIRQTFIALDTSDTNWSYNGGLTLRNINGQKSIHALFQIARITGGAVPVTTTPVQLAVPIPLGSRPKNYSATRYGVMQDSAGADVWGIHIKFDKDGKMFLATDQGASSVAIGNIIEVDMWWSL